MKKEIMDDMGSEINLSPLYVKETLSKHFFKVLGDLKTWLETNSETSIETFLGIT
jgi:hypothetical protein